MSEPWWPTIDGEDIEQWFADHFGDPRLFRWLVEDIVMDEAARCARTGESFASDEVGERCHERIETTLLALVEAEAERD